MAETKEITLSAGPIRYEESGTGAPLVFLHGVLVNGRLWRKVVPLLESDARCIVPDLPLGAHAKPMRAEADLTPRAIARLIDELLAALDLENVTLVANDSGGALVQLLITDRPAERVGAVVLTPCDCFDRFFPPLFRPLQLAPRVPGMLYGLMSSMRLRPARRLPLAFGWLAKRPIDDEVSDEWVNNFFADAGVRHDVAKFLLGIDKNDTLAASHLLKRFDRPVLLAWAEDDRFFPLEYGKRLADCFGGARFETIADSYTFVPEDQPERLAELIRTFIREPSTSPPAGT